MTAPRHTQFLTGVAPQSPPQPAMSQIGGTHYIDMAMQPWDVMESVLTAQEFIGFLKGNIIKYSMRQGRKAGSDDAAKAQHYRDKLAQFVSGD